MAETIRVEMGLTTKTCEQAELLRQRFGCATKAQAVSTSLDLTALLVDTIENGGIPIVRMPNGELKKLVISGLTR
jgi:hypothetical protein